MLSHALLRCIRIDPLACVIAPPAPDQMSPAIQVLPVHRPEIPPIEAVLVIAEQENVIASERPAALPNGQFDASRRHAFGDCDELSIDRNCLLLAADLSIFQRCHALDDRPVRPDKSMICDPENWSAFRRKHDPVSNNKVSIVHTVKASRRTVGPVPDKLRLQRDSEAAKTEDRQADGDREWRFSHRVDRSLSEVEA